MTKRYCDLHTHTTISDGIYTPEDLIKKAVGEETGLSVLCMTDHNQVNYDLPVLRKKYPQIELPYGCEFSCQYTTVSGRLIQVHVGGIGFDPYNEQIQRVLQQNQNSMRPYLERAIQKLRDICRIDIGSYDSLVKKFNNPNINRKHIAIVLTQLGYSDNVENAFDTFLSNRGGQERPAYVSNAKYFATMADVILAITSSGGIASLNHLYDYIDKSNLSIEEVHGLLTDFKRIAKSRGALEAFYISYSPDQTEVLKFLAMNNHLLLSAGSDFHGDGKKTELGKYPYIIYQYMLEAMHSNKGG